MNNEQFPGVRRLTNTFSYLGSIVIALGIGAVILAVLGSSHNVDAALGELVAIIAVSTLLMSCGFFFAGSLLDVLLAIELNGRDI